MDAKLVIFGVVISITIQVIAGDETKWNPLRNTYYKCSSTGNVCYNSGQCCDGLICAEQFGNRIRTNPETPGMCIREKEVDHCRSDEECPQDYICSVVDVRGLVRSKEVITRCEIDSFNIKKIHLRGEGDQCLDSLDCEPGLCCQDVRRWRQPLRRICDQKRRFTKCVTENDVRKR
ncbi:unnamed protein product [Owenia fusiformis]|uniref:Uncharacterized protein n=1 Tax=Owenia fusiformis TaxID=6347 RepID=A0A8J1TPY4_OWEFU|nr:unnamed protein product [Owenia fusiformis]